MTGMLDPGNVGKGFCLKCKTPLEILLPDETAVRLFCLDCTKKIKQNVESGKNNPNRKRMKLNKKTGRRIM
jgi:hypothetical protein